MTPLQKIYEGINKAAEIAMVAALLIILISMTIQVAARYIFNNPFVGNEEITMYLLLWICFIGAGYGVKNRIHIRMSTFVKILPIPVQKYIALAMNLIAICGFLYIYPFSVDFFVVSKDALSPGLQIPMHYYIAALPIGLAFLLLSLVVDSIRVLRNDLPENY